MEVLAFPKWRLCSNTTMTGQETFGRDAEALMVQQFWIASMSKVTSSSVIPVFAA